MEISDRRVSVCNCVDSQMTKKIKKLERETIVWRTKWENNNKALLQMAEEVRWCPSVLSGQRTLARTG